jgi:hypothetical protein
MYKMMKAMNAMHMGLKELEQKIGMGYDHSEFTEEVLILAFMARKGVQDRMDEYQWLGHAPVHVQSISDDYIQLDFALSETIGKLNSIARSLEMKDLVEDIMAKGDGYSQVLKIIPKYIMNDI